MDLSFLPLVAQAPASTGSAESKVIRLTSDPRYVLQIVERHEAEGRRTRTTQVIDLRTNQPVDELCLVSGDGGETWYVTSSTG
jgi:hypothetical protein